ncbi:glutamine-hydrolyzing carbamoyl-phosphate synthase small subunit [Chitinophaga sp. sic0106]|uniref:glutamine-hydrolyzing carbamoyl-phosphate synthase small subunit n=1 Tax=Chitinophaga sp. sic0106 TaxID=2854785 RepID=UPI001C45DBB7|nr:glutamine-hydrolyzing carbamoyl-phosphate synthase small subunit [Chitinophaga sp. sic0106]MBV7533561.1 glutamine-hydrolyzing carbamoyl-phosphate synthase small subunit [Chitinophaga sp. sic0106]
MPQTRTIQPAILLLDDGTVFQGKAFGKIGTAAGELAFNTGMTGYQEVFTDPSYKGQVLIMNNCYIGNYGTKTDDVESSTVKISGLIAKNIAYNYSRKMADESLEKFLADNNLVAIYDVDTRALVSHIRSKGAMNCIISSEILDVAQLKAELAKVPSMEGLALSQEVSTKEAYTVGDPEAAIRIAVMDNGVKRNMLKCLSEKGAYLKVFPTDTKFEVTEEFKPNAYFISNGPGDPAPLKYAIDTVKQILAAEKPLFGICLGHQLLALAHDIPTYKMHHGHRGLNHPVKNLKTGLCEITTQNHGFAVDGKAVEANPNVEVTHINLNDNTVEGIRIKNKPAFSVQYHPESTPGPHDSRYLFDDFFTMIKANMQ